jgi:ribulose-phosphate 3-epimerase
MIEEPLEKIESFVAAGTDILTLNVESTRHIHRALQMLGEMENANDPARGILRGVVLNPGTPLAAVRPLVDDLEIVMLLGVNPGWGGQKFIPSTLRKLGQLIDMIRDAKQDILVGIDGGINKDNIADAAKAGADIIVTGSAVFDGKAPGPNAKFMLDAVRNAAKR